VSDYSDTVLAAVSDTIGAAGETITIGDTQSTATITAAATVSNNDTVTINGRVYTFKTALTPAANEVLINGRDGSLTNLASCINGSGDPGTDYGAASSVSATVTASAVSSHAITLTSIAYGTASNALTLAKSATNLSISGALFTGGGVVTSLTGLVSREHLEFVDTEGGRMEHFFFNVRVLASDLSGGFAPTPDVLATARGIDLRIGAHNIGIFPGWYSFQLVSRNAAG
jgi:hypothetical protein